MKSNNPPITAAENMEVDLLNSTTDKKDVADTTSGTHDTARIVSRKLNAGRLGSGTHGTGSTLSGTRSIGSSIFATVGLEIGILMPPADTQVFNKFQVDFNVNGLPGGLDPYNPEDIDITVSVLRMDLANLEKVVKSNKIPNY